MFQVMVIWICSKVTVLALAKAIGEMGCRITGKVVSGFWRNFWRRGDLCPGTKEFNFGYDPDHRPDPGVWSPKSAFTGLSKKLPTNFNKILWRARMWPRDQLIQLITFWYRSANSTLLYCQNPLLAISAPPNWLRPTRAYPGFLYARPLHFWKRAASTGVCHRSLARGVARNLFFLFFFGGGVFFGWGYKTVE